MAEKEYSTELQKLFLEIMLSDAQCFVRVQNIYNPENFDRSLRRAAEYIKTYSEQYNDLPTAAQIRAATAVDFAPVGEITHSITEWFLDEFEGFTRHQTLKRAILESADLIGRGEYEPIESMIKQAVQISLTRDLGTDYFADPRGRLMKLKSNNGQMTTGWPTLDHRLFGGFNRGELEIFAGSSGSGKSLLMQNLAVNWMQAGIPGVYITLELSEELCAMRIDSMTVGVSTREIFKELDTVEMQVRMAGKKGGGLRIKYMPAQSTSNDIRSYLNELQIQTGIRPVYLCVDYLDLLMPAGVRVSPSDLFIKDKHVSEELRNLAKELNLVLVTASQLNRSAIDEIEFDHSHMSGGISKINTADNVFGIFTSRSMREAGRYQLQLMKTRSSSGVGQKVELQFDVDTLRITDAGEDAAPVNSAPSSAIMDQIRKRANNSDSNSAVADAAPKINADVQSTKLKQMLANLKK